jgi:thiosulfate/3-mercaptopyruvate sulfurtransferase
MDSWVVGTSELAAHPQWRVFDCRHDLAQPELGAQQYASAHLPHALHAHLDHDLSGPKTGLNGRHPLPDRVRFAAWLGAVGVGRDDMVVAYDASGGCYAARLWWLMRWMGHRHVAVLDGGLQAWLAEGHPLVTERPLPRSALYAADAPAMPTVDADGVLRNLADAQAVVLDARGAGRYAGEGETLDPVGGHIPGARNRPYLDNLAADGRFKPAATLRAEFERVLAGAPQQVIAQCGSGVTACHNLLALELAGRPGASLYPGSWSEWCSDTSRPVATGVHP